MSYRRRKQKDQPSYFWWALTLITATCFTVLCWSIGSAVFSYPELPRNYFILKKLRSTPNLKTFSLQTMPELGSSPPKLLKKSISALDPGKLSVLNRSLMNSYLKNYKSKVLSTYVIGDYTVLNLRALNSKDLIRRGFILKLQALVQADEYSDPEPFPLILNLIFPTSEKMASQVFTKGEIITLRVSPYFASLLHAEKFKIKTTENNFGVVLTAVSLADFLQKKGMRSIKLKPPEEINIEASFPNKP